MTNEDATETVLHMDLQKLTLEQIAWLHKLKNMAMVKQARLQLAALKEKDHDS